MEEVWKLKRILVIIVIIIIPIIISNNDRIRSKPILFNAHPHSNAWTLINDELTQINNDFSFFFGCKLDYLKMMI